METLTAPKKQLQLEPLTEAQIRQMNREYNASAWDKTIDRFCKYDDVEFYVAKKDKYYGYDRFFAVYTIEEGIRFFNEVSYSTSLTSNGFVQVYIPDTEFSEFEMYGVYTKKFTDADGNTGRLENVKANRVWMADMSKRFGDVFTNIL